MNARQFVVKHRVGFSAELTDRNPNMDGMPEGSTHWRCTLRKANRRLTVYFSQGPAISKEPEAAEVLDCLASDAVGIENARTFEEWCGEYGYDTDSRKAERTFKACETQAAGLRRILGEEAYKALLWGTERL